LLLQIDLAGIKDDEYFLFESDTEADSLHAVMTPPLDLQVMARDGKSPTDKLTQLTQPIAHVAVKVEQCQDVADPNGTFQMSAMEDVDAAAGVNQEGGITDPEHPAKRAKTAVMNG
jgi:hypothetical protein